MLVGGVLGIAGVPPAARSKPGILASVVVLGLLVLAAAQAAGCSGCGAGCGVFAILHGHAHGAELPSGAAAATLRGGFRARDRGLCMPLGLGIAYHGCRSDGGTLIVRAAVRLVAVAGVALAVI